MTQAETMCEKAKKQVKYHSIYLWSAQGQHVRSLTCGRIRKMEKSGTEAARVFRRIADIMAQGYYTSHTRAFDCSGLICWLLVLCGVESKGFDLTAAGLLKRYKIVTITDIVAGDLLYKVDNTGSAYHVGLYVGNGMLVEAKGRDAGVVISTLNSSWNDANRPNYK